jgi:DNA-binding MarR family transcriptional regulator/GNAT superfamily N-acetyltransferase
MATLRDYGGLLLGSRLKRVSEALYAGVDAVYEAQGLELSSRGVPILLLLRDNGPMGITELAAELGQTHPAVSQMSRVLLERGVVTEKSDPRDERRRLLALSPRGAARLEAMGSVWQAVVGAVAELNAATRVDFLAALGAFDAALEQRGFADRINDRLRLHAGESLEIIPFEGRYRDDFRRLNIEWLEKFFYVEAIDQQVLSQPEKHILEPGGIILLARLRSGSASGSGEIVGTCALIKAGRGRFELSKMAVTGRYQGLGIGKRLLRAAIARFRETGARQLFLESSSKLKPALTMYQAHGFVHAPRPRGARHYQRSDVYMVYRGEAGGHSGAVKPVRSSRSKKRNQKVGAAAGSTTKLRAGRLA